MLATGSAREHIVAYTRGDDVLVAVSRWTVRLGETGWGDTVLPCPHGQWTDVLTGQATAGQRVGRRSCSTHLPVALLERTGCLTSPCGHRLHSACVSMSKAQLHPMHRGDDGWWRATVDAAPDARYGFVLDDDPTVLPDPRSPRQPDGVHERSQLWRPAADAWTDHDWHGRSIAGGVIYELHIGTFTGEGTLDSAIDRLDHLVDLGVDFVELMPVNAFAGTHGWGYDGVLWYAVHEPYGGPDALVRFVDACHAARARRADRRGVQSPWPVRQLLAAVRPVPVVGQQPVGRGSEHRPTPDADEVRRYIIDCALRWMRDFHADGLRLDAVHALVDTTAIHILEELSAETDALAATTGPAAVTDRRERPERSAADHPARPRRLRDDRPVGR